MNFSKTHIEMCEKAIELQARWQPKAGDYIGEKGTHRIDMIAPERLLLADTLANIKEIAFWLPRQDQYWEMLARDSYWAIPMSLKKAREFLKTDFDRDDQKDAKIYKLVEVENATGNP